MPLYEYKCDTCGFTFEVIQKFSDPPVETCRECGGPVHKLLSAPAIQFKGSGWYVTDYAKKGGAAAAGSGNGSGKASEPAKSEGKSETKADAKSDAKPATGDSTPKP